MPDYLISIKNTEHGRIRKETIFCSCSSEAEAEVKKNLAKEEYIHKVENNSFPYGHFKVINK
jgi:ribosomal protein S8|tara:strand:+ start:2698 stop:2883 length:186 start_codon:yes stop_codon:yes gene_type:complete